MAMPVVCRHLLFIYAIAYGIPTAAAAPEPKYRPPAVYTSVLVTEIEDCAVKIKEEGVYRLDSQTRPSPRQFPPYCTVKLLAPVGYRAALVFDDSDEPVCRSPSFIAVSDGAIDDLRPPAVYSTEHPGVNFLESPSPTVKVVCGRSAKNDRNPLRFVSSTNLAEIVYKLHDKESAVFSVKFVKEQLTCGEYVDLDHIDREITLTNNGQPGKCQVFLPGGSIVRIDSIKLAGNADAVGKCADGSESYFHLKTGNSLFFLPLVSDKLCGVRDDESVFGLPCKRAIAELVSNSYELEEVKIRFTLASHADSVLDSVICPP